MAEKTKVVKQTKGKVKTPKTFDTGIKAEGRATIVIPGRGKVVIPNPNGDLYFDGTYTKDTGPTHVKKIKPTSEEGHNKYSKHYHRKSTAYDDIWIEMNGSQYAITGVLNKKDYLYLARRGCVINNGIINIPTEHLEAVQKYLKNKENNL